MLALLLDLALVLDCPERVPMKQKAAAPFLEYFSGPHFDWTPIEAHPKHVEMVQLTGSSNAKEVATVLPAVLKLLTRRREGSRHSRPFAVRYSARRYVRGSARTLANAHESLKNLTEARIGSTLLSSPLLEGCMFRYLLRPSDRTQQLASRLQSMPPGGLSSPGLLPLAVLHLRLGDSFMVQHGRNASHASASDVPRARDLAAHYFRDPQALFRCLASYSESHGECMGCAVISDAAVVHRDAVAHLEAPMITPGVPVHTAVSSSRDLANQDNHAKTYLDWWLLARANTIVHSNTSSFTSSAITFRDATALGRSVNVRQDCLRLNYIA